MRSTVSSRLLALLLLVVVSGCSLAPWDGDGTDPVNPPKPGPGKKLWVVIVESPKRLQPRTDVENILNGSALREYCQTHCKIGPDGKTPEFRVYFDSQDVSRESPAIRSLHTKAAADSQAKGVEPWVALSDGKKVVSKPVPLGLESDGKTPKLVSFLSQYGGR